jgi:hypothetical protein
MERRRGMRGRIIWLALGAGLVLALGAGSAAAKDPQYVGAKKCKTCHKKELIGDQWNAWLKGEHSKAFETLKSDEALKIAKEKGIAGPPSESDDCLKCHMTGFGKPATAFAKKPLKASDGVQCESCHGPGSLYKKKKTMSDHDKAVAAGMWEPGKDEKICAACHNDESPTWDAAKGFNYDEAKEKIAHAIPEDVKGKYLEVEKKLKKEGKLKGDDDEEEEDDE